MRSGLARPASPPVPGPDLAPAVQHRRWMAAPLRTLRLAQRRFGPVFRWDFPAFGPTVVVAGVGEARALAALRPPTLLGIREPLAAVVGPASVLALRGSAPHAARRRLGSAMGSAGPWVEGFVERTDVRLAGRDRVDLYELALDAVTDALGLGLGVDDPAWGAVLDGVFGGPAPGHLFGGDGVERRGALQQLRARVGTGAGEGWEAALAAGGAGADDLALTLLGATREPVAAACAWSVVAACRAGAWGASDREIVLEALRLHPPGPLLRRVTGEELLVGPHRLPPGTQIALATALLHRDPRSYADPDRFQPERWRSSRPPRDLLTWGMGSRRCLGARVALGMVEAFVGQLRAHRPRWIPGPSGVERHNLTLVPAARDVELAGTTDRKVFP